MLFSFLTNVLIDQENNSNKSRMILYYTYSNSNINSYKRYFKDKDEV